MLPAIHIKKTIDFNKGFRSLLEVLKLLAVSEYHILDKKLKTFERLKDMLAEFFMSVDIRGIQHPFLDPGGRPLGVVAVTTDTGLLGGINVQVVTRAAELARENNGELIVIGDRGLVYAQETGLRIVHYPGIMDNQRFAQACQIRDFLTKKVMAGEYGALKVVYPRAHSFVVHRVEVETLIPFTLPESAGQEKTLGGADASKTTIFESTPEEVLEYLVYLVMGQRLYEIFGYSRVCEHAARYLHLEESCNRILEMNKKLYLQYFKRRHEVIDANMRELFSARSIYAKS